MTAIVIFGQGFMETLYITRCPSPQFPLVLINFYQN